MQFNFVFIIKSHGIGRFVVTLLKQTCAAQESLEYAFLILIA